MFSHAPPRATSGSFMTRLDPNERVAVLVTAIGGGGHGEQILKALRAAPETNYRIVGADASGDCPQFEMVDHALTLPKASDHNYIDAVLEVCRAFGVLAVFHGCEPELRAMSEARDRFADAGLFLPINPSSVIELCMDKRRTAEFLKGNGFAPPRFTEISDAESLAKIDWFPVVLKPVLGGGGSRDCFIAQNPRELEILTEYLGTANERFLVQEYVGNYTSEYTVGVLHDMDGKFINSIALKRIMSSALNYRTVVRNLSGRPELGEWLIISSGVSHGTVAAFPEVTEPCERIAGALGCRGAVNIQCRLVDGEVRVFEINPRFSGTTSIRAMLGYNEPDVLIRRHLMGEDIEPRFAYSEGTVFRSLLESFVPESGVPSWEKAIGEHPTLEHEQRQ